MKTFAELKKEQEALIALENGSGLVEEKKEDFDFMLDKWGVEIGYNISDLTEKDGTPTEDFWHLWFEGKNKLWMKIQGISVKKENGKWSVLKK